MGFRVEGVTEASLTSDVFVACLFQHPWKGLVGRSPSAFSERVLRSWAAQFAATPRTEQGGPEADLPEEGGGEGGMMEKRFGRKMLTAIP